MPTLSDARFAALRGQGLVGATSDMLLKWLQNNGALAKAIPDAWREMLDAQGYTTGQRNDDWFELLGGLGYRGSLNDRELQFWLDGGNIGPPVPDTLIFKSRLQYSINPEVANGDPTPTFTRNSPRTIVDFEGLLKTCRSGEVGFMGARRVENIVANSEDLTVGGRVYSGAVIDGPTQWTGPTANAGVGPSALFIEAGHSYVYSVDITSDVDCEVQLITSANVAGDNQGPDVPLIAGQRTRLSFSWDVLVTTGGGSFWTRVRNNTGPVVITQHNAQFEDVSGQANQAPSEYVSNGAGDDHGANVDGVKYFPNTNGNTVDGNGVVYNGAGDFIDDEHFYADREGPYGYAVEGASTNEVLESESFDAPWANTGSTTVQNATTGPDGAQSAIKIVEGDTTGIKMTRQRIFNVDTGQPYTASAFVKLSDAIRPYCILYLDDGPTAGQYFDLRTGEPVGDFNGTPESMGSEELGNGWWRFWITMTPTGSNLRFAVYVNNDGPPTAGYQGDGVSGIYVFGAMINKGTFPTSYIKTEAVTADKASDYLRHITADNFQNPAGTVKAQASVFFEQNTTGAAACVMGAEATALMLYVTSGGLANSIRTFDGTNNSQKTGGSPSMREGPQNVDARWGDQLIAYYNGSAGNVAPYSGIFTSVPNFALGCRDGNTSHLYGTVRNVEIYNVEDTP